MQSKTIGELIKNTNIEISEDFLSAKIDRISFNQRENRISLFAGFEKYIPHVERTEFEASLSKALGAQAVLCPRFPENAFTSDIAADLSLDLKAKLSMINGYLTGASADIKDNILTVYLKNGGREKLMKAHFCENLSALINEYFGLSFTVLLDGVTEISREEYEKAHEEEQAKAAKKLDEIAPVSVSAPEVKHETVRGLDDFEGAPIETDSAELIKGRPVKGKLTPCRDISEMSGRVALWGDVFEKDERVTKDGKRKIISISITDYTGSQTLKIVDELEKCKVIDDISNGQTLLVSGVPSYDKYDNQLNIRPDNIMRVKRKKKQDNAPKKRVELHMHTNMSQMDAMTPVTELVKRAHEWGHPAVAITDHGVVQAFPDAMYLVDSIREKDPNFKLIYGVEAYAVNDCVTAVKGNADCDFKDEMIIFDLETTGTNAQSDRITEIGAVKIKGMFVTETFNTFVNPERPIPAQIVELTSITDNMVKDAPKEKEALEEFLKFCGSSKVLVAHNADFDTGFLKNACERNGITYDFTAVDTLAMSRAMLKDIKRHKLNVIAKHLGLANFNHHRACDDAKVLSDIFLILIKRLSDEKGISNISEINLALGDADPKTLPMNHQIILVKNKTGLKN
ncbi:MAG: exonuclease domain-containing protein, partial [Oscillospiraceae bacterium]